MGDKIYDEALAKRNEPWISAYWKASLRDLRATLQRNIDEDYNGVTELENAPVNTDAVEGNMGVIDQLRHKSQAHIENCFGMSMVNRMQLFSTKEQDRHVVLQMLSIPYRHHTHANSLVRFISFP